MSKSKPPKAANGEGSLRYDDDTSRWVARVSYRAPDGTLKRLKAESRDRAVAAEKWRALQARKARLEAGIIKPGQAPTVGEWFDHWHANLLPDKLKPTTRQFYERAARLYVKPHLGAKRIDRVRPDDVRDTLKAVQRSSTRNAQKAYQVLQLAFKAAVIEQAIAVDANPMPAVRKPGHTPKVREAFAASVARHVMATADTLDEQGLSSARLSSRWAMAFWTGGRQGECLGLQWPRVDFERGVLDCSLQLQQLQQVHGCGPHTDDGWPCGVARPGHCPQRRWDFPPGFAHTVLHRSLVLTKPKTAAGTRLMPMSGELRAALLAHREATADQPNPHNLVWHYDDGRPINPRDDYSEWQRLLRASGVATDGKPIELHVARHTTVTLLLEAGVDPRVIKEMVGHTTIATTQAYQHVDLELARRAMDKLSAVLSSGDPAPEPDNDGPAANVIDLSQRRQRRA